MDTFPDKSGIRITLQQYTEEYHFISKVHSQIINSDFVVNVRLSENKIILVNKRVEAEYKEQQQLYPTSAKMLLLSSWCNLFTYKTTNALTIPSTKMQQSYNMNFEVKFFRRAYIEINHSKISIRTKSDPRKEETYSRKIKKGRKKKS